MQAMTNNLFFEEPLASVLASKALYIWYKRKHSQKRFHAAPFQGHGQLVRPPWDASPFCQPSADAVLERSK